MPCSPLPLLPELTKTQKSKAWFLPGQPHAPGGQAGSCQDGAEPALETLMADSSALEVHSPCAHPESPGMRPPHLQ